MWLLEPLHVGRGAQPTAPEAGALPETGRYRATFQKSKIYRLLVLGRALWLNKITESAIRQSKKHAHLVTILIPTAWNLLRREG
jgi:hypothetical protein